MGSETDPDDGIRPAGPVRVRAVAIRRIADQKQDPRPIIAAIEVLGVACTLYRGAEDLETFLRHQALTA
jgi:hypothetical protein